jgi:D-alanyl-D-alanine carboxypeptidase (penicillin-binding protein 5/6)
MNLANNHRVSLRELLLGMAIFSGNDAATAVALRFAPTVAEFTEMMTREAAALGLTRTRFVDASGYSEDNMTTAGEFTKFCKIYLEAHPDSIRDYHSVREFAYPMAHNVAEQSRENPRTRVQRNRNTLLGRVEGVDGLKTGYIPESGYNLALTAERNGTRFIAIVLGAPSEWGGSGIRDDDGKKILEWAFTNYRTVRPNPGAFEPVRVWKGRENYTVIVPAEPLPFTALAKRGEHLSWHIEYEGPLIAPLAAESKAGNLVLYDNYGELRRISLVTSHNAERGGFFKRLLDSIRLFFGAAG